MFSSSPNTPSDCSTVGTDPYSSLKGIQEFKICIVGDSSVGKTSLTLRFVSSVFEPTHEPTLGATFLSKTLLVGQTVAKLNLWDTAGQERFRSLTPMYYRRADAVLILFDVTSRRSFESVEGWLAEIGRYCEPEDTVRILVASKIDLSSHRQISTAEASQLAKRHELLLVEVSSKTDSGVGDLFSGAVERVMAMRRRKMFETGRGREREKGRERERERGAVKRSPSDYEVIRSMLSSKNKSLKKTATEEHKSGCCGI